MHEVLEAATLLSGRRTRVHLSPDGIVISRRRGLSGWEEPRLLSFEEVRGAKATRDGRRWSVALSLAEGSAEVRGLTGGDAEWLAGLVTEELRFRTRRENPAFAAAVPMAEFPRYRDELLAGGPGETPALVDFVLLQAVHYAASDVHFDPFHDRLRVRFRIDGVLFDALELPIALHPRVLARLKVLARLSVFRHDVPQEGRTVVEHADRKVDLRVSILPTIHGEKAVLRLFDSSRALFQLDALGMSADTRAQYQRLISRPQGMLLLTGPANSGKTTTLYATLNHLYQHRRDLSNIVTVEDPVEYDLQVISQTQTNPARGLTFATGLRTVLRQDPEVIMVGEIRDFETAEIAVRAGLTGHLILSTAHARSACGVFARIIDVGVEPFLVASSVTGVMEQRLVRRNCPHCAEAYQPDPELLRRAGFTGTDGASFRQSRGCEKCGQAGHVGRVGVFSLLEVDDEMRALVMSKAPLSTLEEAGRKRTAGLLAEGRALVAAGVTTVAELLRVVEADV